MKFICLFICSLVLSAVVNAQEDKIVKWTAEAERINDSIVVVNLIAHIEEGWHLYSQLPTPGGPQHTVITFMNSPEFILFGEIVEPKPIERFEPVFNMIVKFFEGKVKFSQQIKVKNKKAFNIKGEVYFMACDDETCLAPEAIPFDIKIP